MFNVRFGMEHVDGYLFNKRKRPAKFQELAAAIAAAVRLADELGRTADVIDVEKGECFYCTV